MSNRKKDRRQIYLSLLFAAICFSLQAQNKTFTVSQGAVVRGDSTKKELALIFTADEFGEGLPTILQTLKKEKVAAGFFFTGKFYRNPTFQKAIQQAKKDGHYLGPHSDAHLLYCDWSKRDSLLVTKDSFETDIAENLEAMKRIGVRIHSPQFFIAPFEWWNDSVAVWSKVNRLLLFSFTPGIRTAADYTWPELGKPYKSNEWIMNWLQDILQTSPHKLNGAIVLIHAGTDPRRKDKFYNQLGEVVSLLKTAGYSFKRIDGFLK